MTYQHDWAPLLASLNTWAEAQEMPDGIQVSFVGPSGTQRVVGILMTPGDWVELSEVIGREDEDTIRRRILGLKDNEHFLVCDGGVELIASSTRELPPDDFVPEPGGEWVASDEAGNMVSRFGDWPGEAN